MLWCVCVSYFSFSLFGLLRHVVSSTLSCFSHPRGLGLNNWVVLRQGNKLHCRCNNLPDNVCVRVCQRACVCVRALVSLVRGNDCYYSRAREADTRCPRKQTCRVSMCVFVSPACRLQEDGCAIWFVIAVSYRSGLAGTSWLVLCLRLRAGVLTESFSCCCFYPPSILFYMQCLFLAFVIWSFCMSW